MGDGNWLPCAFVNAEIADFSDFKLLGAFTSKVAALRHATKENGSLLWSGQGPREFWLVVAPLDGWS